MQATWPKPSRYLDLENVSDLAKWDDCVGYLSHPEISTIIPGLKTEAQLRASLAAAEAGPLPPDLGASIHRFYPRLLAKGHPRNPMGIFNCR